MICRYNYCSYAVDNLFFSRYFFRVYPSIWIPLRGYLNERELRVFFVFIMRMAFTRIVYPPREVLAAGFFLCLGGFVEIPGRNKQSLPVGSLHIVLLPSPPENPPSPCCDNHQKVDGKSNQKRGEGDAPRMLPPPPGERGGHPQSCCRE